MQTILHTCKRTPFPLPLLFRSAMSTSSALSLSSFLSPTPNLHTHATFLLRFSKPPFLSLRRHNHLQFRTFNPSPIHSSAKQQQQQGEQKDVDVPPLPPTTPPADTEKRSFAVATGELFLGIAARLIRGRKSKDPPPPPPAEDFDLGSEFPGGRKAENGEEIAVVIEDSVEPVVLWEQRVKDVEAEKRRKAVTSPGFSFSAAGLLFPYHLGVAQFLIENGYIKETTPLAGSSAGAIICAVIASGRSMQEALDATKFLADDCRQRGTAFRLGAVLRDVLEKVLPDDIHIRCCGRVRVAVTQIVWRPRGLLIDQFDSREDLINAVFTSSFIPGYLAPRPATMFRNRLCIDGGLTLFMPPTSASQTVRVCAFPASSLRMQGIGISPDCNPDNKLSIRQLFNWALEPAEDSMLDKLFEFGYADASIWAKENPVNSVVQEDTL